MALPPDRKPIIYSGEQDVRFGDLDPYGHLNAKHYIDLVASSRFIYLKTNLNSSIEDLIAKGVGFYLIKATQNFRKAVQGVQRVLVKSHVRDARGAYLFVEYTISNLSGDEIYSDGSLDYAVVDPAAKKPIRCPEWVLDLFFIKA